jgi:hypothetical protein
MLGSEGSRKAGWRILIVITQEIIMVRSILMSFFSVVLTIMVLWLEDNGMWLQLALANICSFGLGVISMSFNYDR